MSEKLGATGQFPRGKLSADDEGELQFAIAADKSKGVVFIDFGKPVAWMGLPKDVVQMLIKALNEQLAELEK